MVKKLTDEEVKGFVYNIGYIFIKFLDIKHRKLLIECNNGHKYITTYSNLKRGSRCRKCMGLSYRKPFEEIIEYVKNTEDVLLSTKEEYYNNTTKLMFLCHSCGFTYKTTWNHYQQGSRCEKCSYVKRGKEFIKEKNPCWKGGVTNSNIPLYNTYASRLVKKDNPSFSYKGNIKVLNVSCYYCGKIFMPTKVSVKARINSIEGKISGQNNFYCSNDCKDKCSFFGQIKYPKNFKVKKDIRWGHSMWATKVKELANYTCQKCGKQEKTMYAHHIIPYAICKFSYLDLHNGLCLCYDCHKKVHVVPGCTNKDLTNN